MVTKSTKKTAVKNDEQRRVFTYALTAKGIKELAERGGQAALIYAQLKKSPRTAHDLVSTLVRRFENKNIAKLNIAWYLTKWKAASFVVAKKSK